MLRIVCHLAWRLARSWTASAPWHPSRSPACDNRFLSKDPSLVWREDVSTIPCRDEVVMRSERGESSMLGRKHEYLHAHVLTLPSRLDHFSHVLTSLPSCYHHYIFLFLSFSHPHFPHRSTIIFTSPASLIPYPRILPSLLPPLILNINHPIISHSLPVWITDGGQIDPSPRHPFIGKFQLYVSKNKRLV